MKKNIVFIFALLFSLMQDTSYGVMDSCRLDVPAEENGLMGPIGNMAEHPGPAVIHSSPVVIPAFWIQFVDEKSGQPVIPSEVNIAYGWKWLEYPYPEHSWGAWSVASDWVKCFESKNKIEIPEFEVRPRGWYDGKYTKFPWNSRPSFTHISISLAVNGCSISPGASISEKEARKLKNKTVIFKVNCKGKSTIIIE